jgi:hypothetical protein
VLHPVVEVLFGEARESTAGILLLMDWSGEERQRKIVEVSSPMCKTLHTRLEMVGVVSPYHAI